jgi:hypothetical protein
MDMRHHAKIDYPRLVADVAAGRLRNRQSLPRGKPL